jgi:hypothetical protein
MDNNKLNFITTYLRHRSVYTAYCIAYNVEDQRQYESIMSAGQQLMDDPEVGGLIRSVLEHVHYEVEQEIRAQQKTELLTIQRKRELLANIATGEMYAIQNYKGKDCNQCTQMVRPSINQMLKAIDLDSKLAGHYSVDKRQATVDSLQLTKSENTSETQPRLGGATTEQSPLPGRGLGEAYSHTENTTMLQQNTTTDLSPAGGGVRRTGVEHSRRAEQQDFPLRTSTPLPPASGGQPNRR